MIKLFKIKDKSMEPAFKEDDYVITIPYISSLKKNDIIVFRKKKIMIKRVKKITNNGIFVDSDNKIGQNSKNFGLITKKSIIGKVLFHFKK